LGSPELPHAAATLPTIRPRRVLVAGVSTRAAAESAARAGFAVTAIDAFGDLDQHESVRALSLGRSFTARAAAEAGWSTECDAVVYLSPFENHPKAASALAAGRALWGNPPEVLRRVRDPMLVAQALRGRGCDVPDVCLTHAAPDPCVVSRLGRTSIEPRHEIRPKPNATWLVKPLASGGGHRVRPWRRTALLPRGCYLQELVDGTPGSIVFAAAGGRAVPLGVSRQLVGDPAFGAAGYRYCGNILVPAGGADDGALVDRACALARAVAEEFGVVGVNGIDFIASDGLPYAIEVNPRWCASMELVERAYGLSVFGAHAAACANGVLPEFDLFRARRGSAAVGKAVVFARRDVAVGDTREWLADASVRDVPHPRERIPAGRAVCTVFATGREAASCHAALARRAERVYEELDAWARGVA
jgi:predicted ATP-grasp superfamily ATP-dependent carboligase